MQSAHCTWPCNLFPHNDFFLRKHETTSNISKLTHNIIIIFENDKKSSASTELVPNAVDLGTQINLRKKRYSRVREHTDDCVRGNIAIFFIYLHNFFNIHAFVVNEFIAVNSTELPCLSNLKIQGNFRFNGYSEVLVIESFDFHNLLFMFWRSRNSLLIFLLNQNIWVSSKIQVMHRQP